MDVVAIHIDSTDMQFHSSPWNEISAGTPEIQATTIFDFSPKVDSLILPDLLNVHYKYHAIYEPLEYTYFKTL